MLPSYIEELSTISVVALKTTTTANPLFSEKQSPRSFNDVLLTEYITPEITSLDSTNIQDHEEENGSRIRDFLTNKKPFQSMTRRVRSRSFSSGDDTDQYAAIDLFYHVPT